jgi:hypothetical protein
MNKGIEESILQFDDDCDEVFDFGDCNESQPCRGDECDTSLELELLLLSDEELATLCREILALTAETEARYVDAFPF